VITVIPEITLGNLLTIAAIVLSIVGWYFEVRYRLKALEEWREAVQNEYTVFREARDAMRDLRMLLENFPPHKHSGVEIIYPGGGE